MRLLAFACLVFALAMAPSAFLARAEGEQVMGTMPCKALGLELVQFSVGERVVAAVCMSAAEMERASYKSGPDKGVVACRVLIIRSKQ